MKWTRTHELPPRVDGQEQNVAHGRECVPNSRLVRPVEQIPRFVVNRHGFLKVAAPLQELKTTRQPLIGHHGVGMVIRHGGIPPLLERNKRNSRISRVTLRGRSLSRREPPFVMTLLLLLFGKDGGVVRHVLRAQSLLTRFLNYADRIVNGR